MEGRKAAMFADLPSCHVSKNLLARSSIANKIVAP